MRGTSLFKRLLGVFFGQSLVFRWAWCFTRSTGARPSMWGQRRYKRNLLGLATPLQSLRVSCVGKWHSGCRRANCTVFGEFFREVPTDELLDHGLSRGVRYCSWAHRCEGWACVDILSRGTVGDTGVIVDKEAFNLFH